MRRKFAFVCFVFICAHTWAADFLTLRATVSDVYVITENTAADMEAMSIVAKNGWNEVEPRDARYVLAIVQTEFHDPLAHDYFNDDVTKDGSLDEDIAELGIAQLKKAVRREDLLSGDKFAVYLYLVDKDRSVHELREVEYPAR